MTKIDHDAALELAEAYISWWNRSAAPIKSEYATLLARAYIDLRAERDLLRKYIERMISACGNTNAIRGCQLIVKLGKEALAGSKDE